MLLMMGWLGISPSNALSYSLFLHLGTMTAVLIRFRRGFISALKNISSQMTKILVVSTFCTGITGIPLYHLFREGFQGGMQAILLIGTLLVLTGLLLRFKGSGTRDIQDMKPWDGDFGAGAGLLHTARRLSIYHHIDLLLMRNLKQEEALTVSFLISVPAVMGAIVFDHSLEDSD